MENLFSTTFTYQWNTAKMLRSSGVLCVGNHIPLRWSGYSRHIMFYKHIAPLEQRGFPFCLLCVGLTKVSREPISYLNSRLKKCANYS